MRTLFLVNPKSGRDSSAPVKRALLDAVDRMPDAHAVVLTREGEALEAARDAAQQKYDRVVVAGGDGTINEAINGIAGSDIALGIVPVGTGNVLAHELGLQRECLEDALAVLEAGRTREIDLGEAGGTRFLLMAGFGFDAEVVCSVQSRAKGVFGRMAYAPTLVRESVIYQPSQFRIVLDDGSAVTSLAYTVVICNCASYAPNFKICPEAKLDDGLLDILVFEHQPAMKLRVLGWLSASLITELAADSSVLHHTARRIRIESDPVVKMQIDGDVRGESPTHVKVLPKALRLIVP